MRSSFSCVVAVRRFSLWRGAVAAVALAALAAIAAWTAAMIAAQPPVVPAVVATALALAIVALALPLLRVDAGVLSCLDGRWSYLPDRQGDGLPRTGHLAVALDLGAFLLLTLTVPGTRSRRWLPVQRRGLESDWHALRCAVYSPPLVAPDVRAADDTPS